jgi:hypothetical protein
MRNTRFHCEALIFYNAVVRSALLSVAGAVRTRVAHPGVTPSLSKPDQAERQRAVRPGRAARLRRDGAPQELNRQLWRTTSGGTRDEMP